MCGNAFYRLFYFHVIQGQGIIHDFFESKLRLLIRITFLCIKSYGLVGKNVLYIKVDKILYYK